MSRSPVHALRILVLVDCYLPSIKSAAKLMHDLSCEFRGRGHEVIVLTPSDAVRQSVELSQESGIRIARIKTGKLKGARKQVRALREILLSSTFWRKGKRFFAENPCDLIVFYSPTIFWGSLVRKLKDLWQCPAYLILRDIWPQFLLDVGELRPGLLYRFFKSKEVEQNDAADTIGVLSPGDLQYFAQQFPAANYELEVLHNWAPLNEQLDSQTTYRKQLGLEDKVIFFYGGNFGVAQDLTNIVRLARNLKNEPRVFFLLVGWGSETDRLRSLIRDEHLSSIRLLPAVSQQEYLSIVSEIDVGLISLDRRFNIQNIPGKLTAYLSNAKPVLASVNPGNDLIQILEQSNAGLCCINGEDAKLAACALTLSSDSELRGILGRNGRRLFEAAFSVVNAADQVLRTVRTEPMSSSVSNSWPT
jgi:glycosyltransferase involved in cell wall biosynthesis